MKNCKGFILDVIKSTVVALFASTVFILIFALIVKLTDIATNGIIIGNYIIKALSIIIGIMFGIKQSKSGALKGLITGLLFMILSFLLFSLISQSLTIKAMTAIDTVGGMLVGLFSGIITVNLRRDNATA